MNAKQRIRGSLTLAAALCAVLSMRTDASAAAQTGSWQQGINRRSYIYADDTAAVGEVTIDGTAYLFAPNGVQQVGWQTVGAQRRYFDPATGEPVTGWMQWRGSDYYIDPENGKQTGVFSADSTAYLADSCGVLQRDTWCCSEGTWYHADADGKAAAGETQIGGVPYLFSESHVLLTGWQTASDGITRYYAQEETPSVPEGWLEISGSRYYADPERGRLCGMQEIEGQQYYFDENGVMQTGFCTLDDHTIYLAADGAMQTGWLTLEDSTYYLDADGCLLTGMQTIGDERYDFDAEGVMQTGWQTIAEQKYYFAEDGKAARGLQQIEEDTYYFDASGVMQTGSVNADGVPCYFDAAGRRIDGFHSSDAGITYTDPLTGENAVGWVTVDAKQYYFDADGIAATGIVTMDGKNYRFTENGVYNPVKICLDAGHYAKYNRSPVNPVYYESDFNWKMHLYLKEELEKYNITVITTRADKDVDLPLEDRGKTSAGCDLFLSLHSNASTSPYDDGPLACVTITGTCDQLGLDLANVVADVMGTRQRGSIWKRYGEKFPNLNYYGVLRGATFVDTPAILLEHSYHTNLRATNWLLVDANVRKLAVAEARFLAAHFGMG